MSSRESGPEAGEGHLADLLPIDRAAIESLSWELGHRVTAGGDATLVASVVDRTTKRTLTVFEATDHTCIVRFRTPVGREKFFGVANEDLRPTLARFRDRGDWVLVEGSLDAL